MKGDKILRRGVTGDGVVLNRSKHSDEVVEAEGDASEAEDETRE